MKIFPPQIVIENEEGFTKEKDIFSRESFGKGLANLLSLSEDPLVLALDGPWGTGKTTFIKMWAGMLRKEMFPVIYFDAFANDFIDDAFLAIAGEVLKISKDKKKQNTAAYKKYLKSASTVGRVLIRSGVKIGVKAATLGALEAADLGLTTELNKDASKEASKKIDEYIGGLLESQQKEQESVKHFRSTLAELAVLLSEKQDDGERPLIFIIDELDRCKPPFALQLLEKIKHVFSVKGVHFMLVTNLLQLENSVRFNYGSEVDARNYLQKFYSLIVHLPGDGKFENEKSIRKFLSYLQSDMTFDHGVIEFIERIAKLRELSFRSVEKICTYISLATAFTTSKKTNYFRPAPIVAGLCVLKTIEPRLYVKAKSGDLTPEEAYNAFGFPWRTTDGSMDWSEKWWRYCLEPQINQQDWTDFRSYYVQFGIRDRDDILRVVANYVVDRMEIPEE